MMHETCPNFPMSSFIWRRCARVVGQPLVRVVLVSPFVLRSVDPPIEALTRENHTLKRALSDDERARLYAASRPWPCRR